MLLSSSVAARRSNDPYVNLPSSQGCVCVCVHVRKYFSLCESWNSQSCICVCVHVLRYVPLYEQCGRVFQGEVLQQCVVQNVLCCAVMSDGGNTL